MKNGFRDAYNRLAEKYCRELEDSTSDIREINKHVERLIQGYDRIARDHQRAIENYENLIARMQATGADVQTELEELARMKQARARGGHAKYANSDHHYLREKARIEWPAWKPETGKRTKAAYYNYFYDCHGAPADQSTMYRWLEKT